MSKNPPVHISIALLLSAFQPVSHFTLCRVQVDHLITPDGRTQHIHQLQGRLPAASLHKQLLWVVFNLPGNAVRCVTHGRNMVMGGALLWQHPILDALKVNPIEWKRKGPSIFSCAFWGIPHWKILPFEQSAMEQRKLSCWQVDCTRGRRRVIQMLTLSLNKGIRSLRIPLKAGFP